MLTKVLEEEKRELLAKYDKGLEEEKRNLLIKYDKLVKRNADMEREVKEKEERNMELRLQIAETIDARKIEETKYE